MDPQLQDLQNQIKDVSNTLTALQNRFQKHKHTGSDLTQKITTGSGTGDMETSTYDPAGIDEQLVGIDATQTLTNKTISGGSNTLTGIANSSLAHSSVTIGTSSVSLGSTITALQGLTTVSVLSYTAASSGSTGTVTFDLSSGNVQNFAFSGSSASDSITFSLTNATTNQIFIMSVTQNSGGSGTVTWFSTIRWTGGGAPTLTTTANKRDTFGFICTGAGTYDGFVVGQNI